MRPKITDERASVDSVRQRNLSRLLRTVHRTGGVSRSDLTARLGLNRSTIADLVAQLVASELVVESIPVENARVGRPSPIVSPGAWPVTIAVNPEIDAVTVAVVSLGGRIIARERRVLAAVPSPAHAVQLTSDIIRSLLAPIATAHRVVGVGVAVPGLVSAADGVVRLAPHLQWRDVPLVAMLGKATGFPVTAANDAHLGCLAESAFGAGRDVDHIVYLNGGASGIGGGVIANGAPLVGVDGFAGEFGHTLVRSDGGACHCGASGCLETEVRREPLLRLLGLDDSRAGELHEMLIASNDPFVADEVRRQLGYLAIAIRNAINLLNPQRVILGGFLASLLASDPEFLDDLVTSSSLGAAREGAFIEVARLGSAILLIGAAELAFERTLADPASFSRAG